MNTPIDVPEIERLTKEFHDRIMEIAGFDPKIDVWFYTTCDPRPLAHDALLFGYHARMIPDHKNKSKLSHISVSKSFDAGSVYINVMPRKVTI